LIWDVISDYNNLSELPFPLKEARFGKLGLLKLPILIVVFFALIDPIKRNINCNIIFVQGVGLDSRREFAQRDRVRNFRAKHFRRSVEPDQQASPRVSVGRQKTENLCQHSQRDHATG
jgi:hypothetical protein